jgi:hypothetical protein
MKELLELLSYGLYSRKKEVDVEKPAAHTEKRQESQSSDDATYVCDGPKCTMTGFRRASAW